MWVQCKALAIIDIHIVKYSYRTLHVIGTNDTKTRMWVNAQRDGRPAEYRWRPVFNAAKFD